jgi:F-type H+-transporting ATPase subunit b
MVDLNMTLVTQVFNFLILFVLLKIFAFKPFMKMLDERRTKIEGAIKSAEKDRTEAETLLSDYKQQLAKARLEAQEIVDKANKLASEERDAQILATKNEIERMRKQAQEEIIREREQAVAQLHNEVAALSMAAASKIIAANMNSEANEKLVGEFIEKLDDVKTGGMIC